MVIKMDKTELFKLLLETIKELSEFTVYAFDYIQGSGSEEFIRAKLKSVGMELIKAADD